MEILKNFDKQKIQNKISTDGKNGKASLKIKGNHGLQEDRMQRLIKVLNKYKKNFQDIEKTTMLEDKTNYSDNANGLSKRASIDIGKKNVTINMRKGSSEEKTRIFDLLDDNNVKVTIITDDSDGKCTEEYFFTKKQ